MKPLKQQVSELQDRLDDKKLSYQKLEIEMRQISKKLDRLTKPEQK